MRSQTAIDQNDINLKTAKKELELTCDKKVQRFRDFTTELEQVNKELVAKCEAQNIDIRTLEVAMAAKDVQIVQIQE